MANSMTPGEIYLIEEIDPRTQQPTDYCKIGIVRDKEGRSSEDRAKEHQTGNPRQLRVKTTVKTEIVEAVETTLHAMFATMRISGEWFYMTQAEREHAMGVASSLAQQAITGARDMKLAAELGKTVSSGDLREADAESEAAFTLAMCLRIRIKMIDSLIGEIEDYLRAGIQKEGGTSKVGQVQARKGRETFVEADFKAAFPDLFTQYAQEKKNVTGSFRWAKFPDEDAADVADINDLAEAKAAALAVTDATKRRDAVHKVYLECLGVRAIDQWDFDIAEATVQVICDIANGINGICTWKREEKVKTVLDKTALKKDHPETYARFVTVADPTSATVIAKDTGFEH